MAILRYLRDWWRGYTDADIASAEAKMSRSLSLRSGSIIWITDCEMKAWTSRRVGE